MNEQMINLMAEWAKVQEQLGPLKAKEMELRKQITAAHFPSPKEGTQYSPLQNGWRLKMVHKLGYKLDETLLPVVLEQLRSIDVPQDQIIKTKVELNVTGYKALSDETRAVVNQMVTITPQSPSLELVPPKEPK
jgi:hypothetical protein